MPKSFEEINTTIENLRREVIFLAITREESDALLKLIEGNADFEAIGNRLKAHIAQRVSGTSPNPPAPPPSEVQTS